MKAIFRWFRTSYKTLWGKFLWLFIANAVLSLGFGLLLYHSFGNKIHLKGNLLAKDYFDAVCGVFAIIGLGIAIFQLAALKREEDVIAETTRNIHIRRFILESREPINQVIIHITELKSLIINDDLSLTSVTALLNKVNVSLLLLYPIDSHQDSIECGTIIDCKNCLTLLKTLQDWFWDIIAKDNYAVPKQGCVLQVDKLIMALEECHAKLKK